MGSIAQDGANISGTIIPRTSAPSPPLLCVLRISPHVVQRLWHGVTSSLQGELPRPSALQGRGENVFFFNLLTASDNYSRYTTAAYPSPAEYFTDTSDMILIEKPTKK